MNSKFLVTLLLGAMPLVLWAQDDDMYYVPTKKAAATTAPVRVSRPAPTYYSGSNRNVDEYNRRGGSSYEMVPTDSTGNDIISFNGERGVYPDSLGTEDFALTRQMSRYDGYEPEVAYLEGYNDGRRDSWGWHSPWYYSSFYPWYDSYWYWNDPWYYRHYGWYYGGWYDPWYYNYGWYGYYGGYRPYYYSYAPRTVIIDGGSNRTRHINRMVTNTPRGISDGRSTRFTGGRFGGSAIANRQTATRNRTTTSTATRQQTPVYSNNNGNFGGNRTMANPTTSSSNRSTGSFGGSTMSRSSSPSGSFGGGGGSFGGVSTRGGSRSSRR